MNKINKIFLLITIACLLLYPITWIFIENIFIVANSTLVSIILYMLSVFFFFLAIPILIFIFLLVSHTTSHKNERNFSVKYFTLSLLLFHMYVFELCMLMSMNLKNNEISFDWDAISLNLIFFTIGFFVFGGMSVLYNWLLYKKRGSEVVGHVIYYFIGIQLIPLHVFWIAIIGLSGM